MYVLLKTLHLLFVVAWMATVFYLPRILVNLAESAAAGEPDAVRARLLLMGRRLYRFGHHMFGLAFVFGAWLWWQFGLGGGWLHAKLTLVAGLLAYFVIAGRWVTRVERGAALPTAARLRWFNELPLLLFVPVLYLVLGKPF